MDYINLKGEKISGALSRNQFLRPEDLNNFVVYYTSDFSTISREVDVRTRRVQLLSLEGAGKTTLVKAILNQTRQSTASGVENLLSEVDAEEDVAGGLCYMDSTGVNLQELSLGASRFIDELWMGIRDLSRKIDLIVLVHNLAHKIPQCMSAHQQKARIDAVLQAYQASPSNTEILNSYSYVVHTAVSISFSSYGREVTGAKMGSQNLIYGSLNLVHRPFQRKGRMVVNSLCQLVHRVPHSYEESSFQEFAKDRLLLEMTRGHAAEANAIRQAPEKANSLSAAAVGASLGAGLGIVLAVILGAASALRKP
ncbi:hypothetical protein Ancab_022210 [Ancistrocladus abbreviatus]